jgi:hypothetical protein
MRWEAALRQAPSSEERPSQCRYSRLCNGRDVLSRTIVEPHVACTAEDLLGLARATAVDVRQRGLGATTATEAREPSRGGPRPHRSAPVEDRTRFAPPWLWTAGRTDGRAVTPEGQEFGYELRFSRYKTLQVKP